MLKCDHEAAQSQVYAELVANRLALFLGIPVLVGVPARASASDARLRFAALRAELLALPAVSRCVEAARPFRGLFPPGAPDRD